MYDVGTGQDRTGHSFQRHAASDFPLGQTRQRTQASSKQASMGGKEGTRVRVRVRKGQRARG